MPASAVTVSATVSTARMRDSRPRWRVMQGLSGTRLQAAHHRGAAAEGDDGDAAPRRQVKDGRYLLLCLGPDHGVGGVGYLAPAKAHQVAVAFAEAVHGPHGRVRDHSALAGGPTQGLHVATLQARRPYIDRLQGVDARRLARLAKTLAHVGPEAFGIGKGEGVLPPPPIPTTSSAWQVRGFLSVNCTTRKASASRGAGCEMAQVDGATAQRPVNRGSRFSR